MSLRPVWSRIARALQTNSVLKNKTTNTQNTIPRGMSIEGRERIKPTENVILAVSFGEEGDKETEI